jgi:putative addiction module CopG family antidote
MTEISPDLKEFVDREIANGNFADQEAVVEHALRLMQRDREEAVRGIEAGLEDVAAGRVEPLNKAFDDLRNEFGIAKDA